MFRTVSSVCLIGLAFLVLSGCQQATTTSGALATSDQSLDRAVHEDHEKYADHGRSRQETEYRQHDNPRFVSEDAPVCILERHHHIEGAQDPFVGRMNVAGTGGATGLIVNGADDADQTIVAWRINNARA